MHGAARLAAIAALFSPVALRAAEGADEPVMVLDEIVIKSGKPTRVETLEVREVRETPARDLGEALEDAGLTAKVRKGGIANDVVVRGFQRDNVTVTIDGARVHGACPNRMDPATFHVDYAEVDRVELRKGPFDVAVPGSMGGALDVRTRSPAAGLATELNAGVGESGALESSATLSYGGSAAGLLGGLAFKASEAYETGDGRRFTELYPDTSRNRYRAVSRDQRAYDMVTGWGKARLSPAAGQTVSLSYAHQDADHVLYPYLLMDAVSDHSDRLNVEYALDRLGPLARARAQAHVTYVSHDMDDAHRCSAALDPSACGALLGRGWSMRTFAETWVGGVDLEGTLRGKGETTFGVNLFVRSWDAATTRFNRAMSAYATQASIPDVRILDAGLHAEHAVGLGRFRLSAGARLDLVRSEARTNRLDEYTKFYAVDEGDLAHDDVLVTGNVQVEANAGRGVTAFAAYGHGARVPDPQERYFALSGSPAMGAMPPMSGTVGRPSLDPARNDEVDVGAKWAAGRLLAKAQLFHAWLGDHVALVQVANAAGTLNSKSWANVRARMWGGEASARVALPASLFLSASVAYTRGENDTLDGPLAEMPPLRGAVALRYDARRWFVEAEEQLAARQDRVDASVGEQPTDAWYTTGVKAGVDLRGVKVFAGVRNLFDASYYESLSYLRDPFSSGLRVPEPGRTLYLNAQYAR